MKVTLAVDNRPGIGCIAEHGLSFYIETDSGSALFDTGESDAFLSNLYVLGKDIDALQAVALSHGHHDHTGGLAALLKRKPDIAIYAHQDVLLRRYNKAHQPMRENGMPQRSRDELGNRSLYGSEAEMLPGVLVSSELPLIPQYTCLSPQFVVKDDGSVSTDVFADEKCVVLSASGRSTALLGCSHRGVENNILAAINMTPAKRIDRVIGGMHLGDADDQRLDELVRFIRSHDIGEVVCCHCTGDYASRYLVNALAGQVCIGCTAMSWEV